MTGDKIITDKALKYIDTKGNLLNSRTELSIAGLLHFLGIDYEHNAKIKTDNGSIVTVDFRTKNGLIEVIDSQEEASKLEKISAKNGERIIAIGNSENAGAKNYLDRAHAILKRKADSLGSEEHRRKFLELVPISRTIISAFNSYKGSDSY